MELRRRGHQLEGDLLGLPTRVIPGCYLHAGLGRNLFMMLRGALL